MAYFGFVFSLGKLPVWRHVVRLLSNSFSLQRKAVVSKQVIEGNRLKKKSVT